MSEKIKLLPAISVSKALQRKTKSVSKACIIISQRGNKQKDNQGDEESQYDLKISIEEAGGVSQFLATPCMILYKRYLNNQG